MPFRTFNQWLFDSDITSDIPKPKFDSKGKVIVPDILKYNSPITHTYVLKLFMKIPELNFYLNLTFNNINLRYLNKKDFFKFIKKCVIDFKVRRNSIMFFPWASRNKLFDKLESKLPLMKKDDIALLCDRIERSDNRNLIYTSLGLDNPKKKKIKKSPEKNHQKKISMKKFIKENFTVDKIKKSSYML